MAIDEGDQSDPADYTEAGTSEEASDTAGVITDVRVGAYTWADLMAEYGYDDEISLLYPHGTSGPDDQLGLDTDEAGATVPSGDDWNRVEFDPEAFLGYHPDELPSLLEQTFVPNANVLNDAFLEYVDPETTPVVKDVYTWEHYKWEYYYDEDGSRPRTKDGSIDRFDEEESLGFDPDDIRNRLHAGGAAAMELDDIIEERTVNVSEDIDEDEFFSTEDGGTTVSNRYDLEKAVPMQKKLHFREVERYWVNKPYAFVIIFHSEKENEKKYYAVEPYLNEIETDLQGFLSGKLRTAIKYSEDGLKHKANEEGRREVIEEETRRLLKRYDLFKKSGGKTRKGFIESLRTLLDDDEDIEDEDGPIQLDGVEARPEPAVLAEDADTLSEYQVEKLLYQLKRNFLGYERIDPIKHDINVEDISCDGYNSPVFVYHSGYEQIISNIYHGEDELDDFVVKLAQRSGKGISKRLPQVDATLPDGSRAQLTLGKEVSDHGTNYTIRQFKDVPFTPVDLINWNTFSLDEMAFLWLSIENHKSLIFAGGTASGKTTSLNAVSLFIPSNTKIVSIEDTREVELPQRNWIASVTRPSFSDDDQGDVDEFDLLEAALRQRPDYIVMGEIRGEEGRTLFQVMSTGHTTYTTFHADSVDEVLKRFTTDPINVSKTMFTALDLVSIQTQTRVQGQKVRRNKSLTEINHYEAEHDEINVQDVYQWQAETDEYLKMGDSNTLQEIQFDRGWNHEKLKSELFKRRAILAYLIKNGLNTYAQVAATVQAFINDPDTILTLIANGQLEASLEDLREMESVLIDVDPEKEELVPRPDSTSETYNLSMDILERAEESLFDEYRGQATPGLSSALGDVEPAEPIEVDRADVDDFDFGGEVDESVSEGNWDLGDGSTESSFESGDGPAWLEDDNDFGVDDQEGQTAEASSADAEPADSQPVDDQTRPALETAANADARGANADTGGPAPDNGSEPTLGQRAGSPPTTPETPQLDESPATPQTDTETTPSAGSDDTTPHSEGKQTGEDDGTLEGLFSNMDSTLETLEQADAPGDETTGPPAKDPAFDGKEAAGSLNAGPDTSDFDEMFPDRDLDAIFGSDSETTESASTESAPSSANEGSLFDDSSGSIFSDDESEGDEPIEESDDTNEEGSSIFSDDDAESFSDADSEGSLFSETASDDESEDDT
ncbi:ATPase, T2SS/T4P/T4SS family [Halobacteria archaeon AArc-curdl1]|uniref:ATPase, T2SS/T4P/T4SS family n=1 Tax=Natronosalvus hydrolyticus TaxID=2979988 RepID=A0AAP2Z8L0_9EURY|nr:ATPase, T2SS/T4P/T4SS family [Halobacteria archaeon AArc-curdl1]